MTKFNNIKIYLALVSVIVALLFSCCIEETPKETNTTTIPSIKPKAEVIEQELKNNIRGLVEVNGKLAFHVEEGGKYFIVYDGKEIGKRYDFAGFPVEVNGKLAYVAKEGDKSFIVYDGKEGKKYGEIILPREVNGKLAYMAREEKSWSKVNGKIIYRFNPTFIVYDGKEIGKKYSEALYPTGINGKLAYVAKEGGKEFIVYDGKEGKRYDKVQPARLYWWKVSLCGKRSRQIFYRI